ncbi:MAG: hypothetical protein KDK34_20650, partial [Leptospiraceae bacterium]|nr:hypothetical protein [Leptospiraceae bacterium]
MKKKKKVQPSKPKPGRKAQNQKSELLTSLGVPLRARGDSEWALDLSNLKLFTGLSVIARLIGDEILDQSRAGQVDIVVQRRVIAEITPELTELGITGISIYALDDVLRGLPSYQQQFHNQIRTVFGTLQRPRWGSILFPELFPGTNKKEHENALLFPFHLHSEEEDIDYFFLVERDSTRGFVRITIERDKGSRINLKSVKAITVDDLDRRTYLQGLTRITESVYLGIQRECENYHNEYMDNARRHGHFFEQLHRVGLTECESITVRWPQEMTGYLVRGPSAEITITLKRALIVLEDKQVVERLLKGDSILMTSNGQKAWLDLSRRGRGLNLSLHQKREAANLEYYLERMPDLEAISLKHPNAFKNMRIFLIHHITGEILGTIRALENMGMSEISVLYVKYAGVVPADYLEALLSLPDNRFHFYGLQKIETHQEIEGHYILSRQYSDISRLIDLDVELDRRRHAFFEAMNYAAGHLFLREALQAREHGERILLIEDGGYLGPTLNQFCLENKTLGDALKHFGVRVTTEASAAKPNKSAQKARPARRRKRSANIDLESVVPMLYCSDADLRKPLYEWLQGLLPATVEHTRNGYNRLEAVQEKFKKLAFPAASIAVSNIKREGES